MASTDLEVLLDMGFEEERAKMAVQKSGGLQGALEWLEANQDKDLEEIKASEKKEDDDPTAEPPALKPGEVAKSLVCNECGKRFRSQAQAEFHASKTEHVDFSESTEEIAPLTEEEKKARLEEMRRKLAEKRAGQSVADKEETKRNEAIRRKATKETQDLKEDLRKKEQLKEAAAKRREKQEELAAKERIRAKIKADQEERRLKAEKEKAEREGRAPPPPTTTSSAPPPPTPASGPSTTTPANKSGTPYTTTRLRLQTPTGTLQKSFDVAKTSLADVASAVASEQAGFDVQTFTLTFPTKVFSRASPDWNRPLSDLPELVPSAVLIVK